jgi:lysozyme
MTPQNEQLLITELRYWEGVRYTEYPDTKGIPTIGVGHNLRVSPLPAGWTQPLNDQQVNLLLQQDLQIVYHSLNQSLPWWTILDDVRQRVICNMCFNLGIIRLLGFHRTLISIKTGAYVTASQDMEQSVWYNEVGERADVMCEAMETGVMPDMSSLA